MDSGLKTFIPANKDVGGQDVRELLDWNSMGLFLVDGDGVEKVRTLGGFEDRSFGIGMEGVPRGLEQSLFESRRLFQSELRNVVAEAVARVINNADGQLTLNVHDARTRYYMMKTGRKCDLPEDTVGELGGRVVQATPVELFLFQRGMFGDQDEKHCLFRVPIDTVAPPYVRAHVPEVDVIIALFLGESTTEQIRSVFDVDGLRRTGVYSTNYNVTAANLLGVFARGDLRVLEGVDQRNERIGRGAEAFFTENVRDKLPIPEFDPVNVLWKKVAQRGEAVSVSCKLAFDVQLKIGAEMSSHHATTFYNVLGDCIRRWYYQEFCDKSPSLDYSGKLIDLLKCEENSFPRREIACVKMPNEDAKLLVPSDYKKYLVGDSDLEVYMHSLQISEMTGFSYGYPGFKLEGVEDGKLSFSINVDMTPKLKPSTRVISPFPDTLGPFRVKANDRGYGFSYYIIFNE